MRIQYFLGAIQVCYRYSAGGQLLGKLDAVSP